MRFPPFMRLESLRLSMWPNGGHVYVTTYLVLFPPLLRFLSLRISKVSISYISYMVFVFMVNHPILFSEEICFVFIKLLLVGTQGRDG